MIRLIIRTVCISIIVLIVCFMIFFIDGYFPTYYEFVVVVLLIMCLYNFNEVERKQEKIIQMVR